MFCHGGEPRLGIHGVERVRHVLEERHARDELEPVDVRAHHLLETCPAGFGAGEVCPHDRGRREQPIAEHSIAKVVGGFFDSGEAVVGGSGRSPQTRELREHVPDPVARLPAGLELAERYGEAGVGSILCLPEAVQALAHR